MRDDVGNHGTVDSRDCRDNATRKTLVVDLAYLYNGSWNRGPLEPTLESTLELRLNSGYYNIRAEQVDRRRHCASACRLSSYYV